MQIQDKVTWDADVEKQLALLSTLGVDCVSMELPDGPCVNPAMDLSTLQSTTAFFQKAKSTVAAYRMNCAPCSPPMATMKSNEA